MKILVSALVLALACVAGLAQGAEVIVPLEGLDPVLLVQGREAQGDEKFSVTRGRFRYLFAGAESKAQFEKEPGRFEIQLGGTCARMVPNTTGTTEIYTVHKGRIYLFGSIECVKAFKAAPENYLEAEASSAPKAAAASAEALKKGHALIERAVEAAGGAAKIDGLKSYQEKGLTGRRARDGVVEMKTSLAWVFPDKFRQERTFGPGMTLAAVITPGEAFLMMTRANSMLDEQRAAYEKQFKRSLLAALRARRGAGFTAAATGAGRAGETSVEQVAVSFDGLQLTLGVEPSTGRVLSIRTVVAAPAARSARSCRPSRTSAQSNG